MTPNNSRDDDEPGKDYLFWALAAMATAHALIAVPLVPKEPELFAQWLFSYKYGFIKRGLVGEILLNYVYGPRSVISIDELFTITRGVSLATFLLAMAAAARAWFLEQHRLAFLHKSGPVRVRTLLVTSLFVATPIGIPYYVANSHYPELVNLLILLALLNVLLFRPKTFVALAVLAGCCLLTSLVHESSLLSTIPAMLTVYYLLFTKSVMDRKLIGLLLAIYVVCVALVVMASMNSSTAVEPLYRSIAGRVTFSLEPSRDHFLVLQRTLLDNVSYAFRQYGGSGGRRVLLSLGVVLPAIVFLVATLSARFNRRLTISVVPIAVLPVMLGLIADDVYRWYVLVVVNLCVFNLIPMSDVVSGVDGSSPRSNDCNDAVIGLGVLGLMAATLFPYPYFMSAGGRPMDAYLLQLWTLTKRLASLSGF